MVDHFRTALDWEDVRVFSALARHRSLSATARALGITHATVARRIAALQASLGTALVERRPGGYDLTASGRLALDAASAMEQAAAALPRLQPTEQLAGVLRLTATPTLAELFLIPHLAAFQAEHPMLDIEVIAERRSVSLSRREADLALRLAAPEDGGLIARRLVTLGYAFYATPAWRARLADGAAPVMIGYDEANAQLPEALWLAGQFPTLRVALRANSPTAQANAARAGFGIALLPRFVGASLGDLAEVALGAVPPDRSIWLLSRDDVRHSVKIQRARDFLVTLFARERALFEGHAA